MSARLLLSQREAAQACGVGLTYFREQILPELRVVRRGRRLLIPYTSLERWVDATAENL